MQHRKRLDLDIEILKSIGNDVRLNSRNATTWLWIGENISKHGADVIHRWLISKTGNVHFLEIVERPEIVQTKNVICMTVCVKDCIDPFQILTNCLLTKIGSGI